MTTTSLRRDIHAAIADDIRRIAVAQRPITLQVALQNWEYFYRDGRHAEARIWWAEVHRLMTEG